MLHRKLKELLISDIENSKVLHLYMFTGEEGIGKKTLSMFFAKALLCQDVDNKPCGTCKSCNMFELDTNVDFIHAKAKKNIISVEETRRINEALSLKPLNSNRKVVLIDEAHKMTVQAQNSILKSFEEPPKYTVIILNTSDKTQLLDTILSRAREYKLMRQNDEDIILELKSNGIELNKGAMKYGNGNIGKVVSYMSDDFAHKKEMALGILKVRLKSNSTFDDDRIFDDIIEVFELLLEFCRDIMVMQMGSHNIMHIDLFDEYIEILKDVNYDIVAKQLEKTKRAIELFKINTNKNIVFNNYMIN